MPTQNGTYTFKSNVNEVLVPVVVRDKQGRVVGGLKKENFQVFDNDKPQAITGFMIQIREESLLIECARGKKPDQFLFTRANGSPVRDFRKAWTRLCDIAKVPGLLVHDMRRTAARNLRRAGVAEGVIMRIGGWKTRSVFERYNIVEQRDIREALHKLEQSQADGFGHKVGHNRPEATVKANPDANAKLN